MDLFEVFRSVDRAIPTLVVVLDGGPTIWPLDDLSRFAACAHALPIACFASTQHVMSIIFISLLDRKILFNC